MQRIGIINYGIGNLGSVHSALQQIKQDSFFIESISDFDRASHVILPGVGAFGVGMENLRGRGFDKAIIEKVVRMDKPLLGICLGMQLLASEGTEFGHHKGLDLIPGKILKMEVGDLRLPHVGWNDIKLTKQDGVFTEALNNQAFYFVHSFYFAPSDASDSSADTDYGLTFTSCVSRGKVFGAQFHPEKSQKYGLQLLKNFCELESSC